MNIPKNKSNIRKTKATSPQCLGTSVKKKDASDT